MMKKNLPEVAQSDLKIWDEDHHSCCGYLSKKASKSSAFSKGKWQKRWFVVDVDLGPEDNYSLSYFHHPEDNAPRQIYPLQGATIKISGDNKFVLTIVDGTSVSLSADDSEQMTQWVLTLEKVINVSNLRERFLSALRPPPERHEEEAGEERDSNDLARGIDSDHYESDNQNNSRFGNLFGRKKKRSESIGGKKPLKQTTLKEFPTEYEEPILITGSFEKRWPMLRLDYDISSIPPGSSQRHHFIEVFRQDLANALNLNVDLIEVISIKSAPSMDWLILVEFNFNLLHYYYLESNEADLDDAAFDEKILNETNALLSDLLDLIQDSNSLLFKGYITSKIDPTFTNHLFILNNEEEESDHIEEVYSSDSKVLKLMHAYKDVVIQPKDESSENQEDGPYLLDEEVFFPITLYYDGRMATLKIPNPAILTPKYCFLWPFEVKKALGFMNTMQELWIEPIELVPRNNVTRSQNIKFSPSVRINNSKAIHTNLLTKNQEYTVICEDLREDMLNSLSKEEMQAIKDIFQKFDVNSDNKISKNEMKKIIYDRIAQNKEIIEERYNKLIQDNRNTLTDQDLQALQLQKIQYLETLNENKNKLITLYESADVNNDGFVSVTEFILAEAWWLRCSLNPERAHLF